MIGEEKVNEERSLRHEKIEIYELDGVGPDQGSRKYFLDAIQNCESKVGCRCAYYKVLNNYQHLP